MNLTKTIQLDLYRRGTGVQIGASAVVGDSGSRSLCFRLMVGEEPWPVPDGVRAAVAFRTEGGYAGEYDQMPDGTDAFVISDNTITVRLIDQVMARSGSVRLMLILRDPQMRQISTFPILMEVEEGIADTGALPGQYYRVRDLEGINGELERILGILSVLDTQANLLAAREAREAAEEAKQAAQSVDAERIAGEIARKGDDIYVEDGRVYLLSDGEIIGEGIELPQGTGGLRFDSGYVDAENRLHLTRDGQDIEGFTPFVLSTGSWNGGGSILRLSTPMEERIFSILQRDEKCVIPYTWSSVDSTDRTETGDGFAEWIVNGSRVALTSVEQGENSFDVRRYLTDGDRNLVALCITDSYGTVRSMGFTITVTAYSLSWNVGDAGIYPGAMGMALRLTPIGTGEKVVRVSVDGTVISESTVSTTGRTISVNVPPQSHGAHRIRAWMEVATESEPLVTEPLVHVGAWMHAGVSTPVVGILTPEVTVGQYGTAAIRYYVVDPAGETTTVIQCVGDGEAEVLTGVDRSVRTWHYKARQTGTFDMVISCGNVRAEARLTVTDPGYDIRPVTAGLELDLDPAGHSNDESGREQFGYLDGEGVNHPLRFSADFDWVNGGFRTDEEGITALVVPRGSYVTLDRGLFDTDCRATGRNIKLIFKAENVRNYDAKLMACKSGSVGMEVFAQQARVSSQLENMTVLYCEGRKIEMDVCIGAENEHSLAWIGMKAIPSCPPVKYGSTDTWGQTEPAKLIIGSEDADVWIYRLKLYGNSLNRYEVLDNFIADCGDPVEMVSRFERNDVLNDDGTLSREKLSVRCGGLRVLHLRGKRMTTGREDAVTADLEMFYGDGGEAHHLTARDVTITAQGTSSLEYILAALNLDLDFSGAKSFRNGLGKDLTAYAFHDDAIPVSYFNLKANVASSESANNVCLADDYNTFDPFVCAGKKEDSRVRDTVEGHPCAVFFTNVADEAIPVGARTVQPGETILYFAGDMNNSKKNFAVFGQDNEKWPGQCCVEVMNNTELPCRFRSEIGEETFQGGNFEFRFPETPTGEMMEAFRAMHDWVMSCTLDQATGEALSSPVIYDGVTYYGDSREYRAAKFRAEFDDHFIRDQMLFHRLFTDENCMTDNNAKNLFLCREYVEELEDYRWCVRCDYDNDTGLGNDNSGGLSFPYGLELHDMVGDSYVFNAHDSTLWSNIDALMGDELTALRISMVGSGVWDPERRSRKFREYQAATPEAVRIEDAWNKYFLPLLNAEAAAYPKKCYGTKEDQREQFLRYQHIYKTSQHTDLSSRANAISMRSTIDADGAGDLTLTGYSDMYFVVMYGGGGTVKVRGARNTPTRIECPTDSLGDTETYIFSASHLTAISSLAALKPKFVLANTAERLQELIIGSGEVGYQNRNLNQIGVGSNRMLRLLDLQGTPNLVTALDLSTLTSLEEFYGNGSGLTGVSFARKCPLKIARIPAVSSFVGLDLTQLETFVMDGSALRSIRVENCPGIDTLALCAAAAGLERGRLTGVDWNAGDAVTLVRLAALAGFDGQGGQTERFVLTGKARIGSAMEVEVDAIRAAFPELELTVDAIVPGCSVTFRNEDGTLLHSQMVREGSGAVDPVAAGLIAKPEKASDVEYHYYYAGWNASLGPINADTVFTAVYTASDRYYRVTYWADSAESGRLQEEVLPAHSEAVFRGEEPTGDGIWVEWDAPTGDIVSDLDLHPVFVRPVLPQFVTQGHEYLYSDDPDDDSALTRDELLGIVVNDQARTYFQLGDRIKIKCRTDNFADTEIVLELRSFRHFKSAERSGEWAGPYFGMVGLMNSNRQLHSQTSNVGGFAATTMLQFLNDVVYGGLPRFWQAMAERIEVLSSAGNTSGEIVAAQTYLTLESHAELGYENTVAPYKYEVAEGADEVTFPCYTDNASRRKLSYNGEGTAWYYWLRSPVDSSATNWTVITSSGYKDENNGTTSGYYGVSFGLCLRHFMPGGEER